MVSYVDTNVIVSYALGDDNHPKAVKMINEVKNEGQLYISTFTIVELYSVLSRNISKYKLPPTFEELIHPSMKVKLAVEYALGKLNFNILPDDSVVKELEGIKVKAHRLFYKAIKLAPKIKLKTNDLVHIAYAHQLKRKGKIDSIMTLDEDFKKKRDLIKKHTKLLVKYQ